MTELKLVTDNTPVTVYIHAQTGVGDEALGGDDGIMISGLIDRDGRLQDDVDVLIGSWLAPAEVAKILRKIADWVEDGAIEHLVKKGW